MSTFLNPEVCVSDARAMLILMCTDTSSHVHVIRFHVVRAVRHIMVVIKFTLFFLQIFGGKFLWFLLRVVVFVS